MSSSENLRCNEHLSMKNSEIRKIDLNEKDQINHQTIHYENQSIQPSAMFGKHSKKSYLRIFFSLHFLGFSYQSNQLLLYFASDDTKYPLFKMLRGVCKVFSLNEIEIITWGIINRSLQLGANMKQLMLIIIKIINLRSTAFYNFIDFLQLNEVGNIQNYKRTLLFLCLSAYGVKTQMKGEDDSLILGLQQRISSFIKIDRFVSLYESVRQEFVTHYEYINLVLVNQIFNEALGHNIQFEKNIPIANDDLNQIVESLLEMAPPYQKDEEIQNQPKKKVKRMKKIIKKESSSQKKQQSSFRKSKRSSNASSKTPFNFSQAKGEEQNPLEQEALRPSQDSQYFNLNNYFGSGYQLRYGRSFSNLSDNELCRRY